MPLGLRVLPHQRLLATGTLVIRKYFICVQLVLANLSTLPLT
jgi:hypothetical protein